MEDMKSPFQRIIILIKAYIELVMSELEPLMPITMFRDNTRWLVFT